MMYSLVTTLSTLAFSWDDVQALNYWHQDHALEIFFKNGQIVKSWGVTVADYTKIEKKFIEVKNNAL